MDFDIDLVDLDGFTSIAEFEAWRIKLEAEASDWLGDQAERIATEHAEAYLATLTAAGDISALDGMEMEWRVVLDEFADQVLTKTFLQGAASAFASQPGAALIGLDIVEGWAAVVNESAVAYQATATNRIVGASTQLWNDVQAKSIESLRSGVEIPKLRKEIESISGFSRSRAQTIARTECLPGDAQIDTANITALYRRPYSGEWYEIVTASGRKLSGTPNHPMLTPTGWKTFNELAVGDNLICDRPHVQQSGSSGDQHVANRPSTIRELFDAATAVIVSERERTTEPDFHGDDSADGYVDVARPDSVLRVGSFAPVTQSRVESVLSPSDVRDTIVACESAPFRRDLTVDQLARLSRRSNGHTGRLHDSTDHSWVDTDVGADREGGLPGFVAGDDGVVVEVAEQSRVSAAGDSSTEVLGGSYDVDVSSPHLVDDQIAGAADLFADVGRATPGDVLLDAVVAINVVSAVSMHVFNLSTANGYFTYNGVYTGNTVAAYNGGDWEGAMALGDLGPVEKSWLAAIDSRTRETHIEVNGVTILMDEAFNVGGTEMMRPHDAGAPAAEVLNCRCILQMFYVGDQRPDGSTIEPPVEESEEDPLIAAAVPSPSSVIVAALVEGDRTVTYADGDVAPLHQTLVYLGSTDDVDEETAGLIAGVVEDLAGRFEPFDAFVCGIAELGADGDRVALTEAEPLQSLHDLLLGDPVVAGLDEANNAHPSWISHVTFGDVGDVGDWVYGDPVRFDRLAVFVGAERFVFDLGK